MDTTMEKKLAEANDLREKEQYGEAARAYTECLIDLADTNDPAGLIHCFGGQSLIYKNLLTKNDSPVYHYLTVSFAKEAYEIGEANKDKIDGRTLAIAYRCYGDALTVNGEFQEALPYFEKAIAVSTAGIPEKGTLKSKIGSIKYMLGEKHEGVSLIEEGLIDIRTGDMDDYTIRVWETGALQGLAKISALEGDIEKAKTLADESLTISTNHNLSIRKRESQALIDKLNSGRNDFSL